MKYKQWLFYSFVTIIILLGIIVSLMYWSDTYSTFHPKRVKFYTEPNNRVSKIEYILENKDKYDSFIFGSSRVSAYNPSNIKNGTYYNMTVSEGIPHEYLLNIRLLLNSGIKIKNLIIALDEFSYKVSFEQHQKQGLTKLHYLSTNTNKVVYFVDNFLRFPLGEDRRHILKKIKRSNEFFITDISTQKQNYLNRKLSEKALNLNTPTHLNSSVFDKHLSYNGFFLNSTIDDIKKIKNICNQSKINCLFFINPIHKTNYQHLDQINFNNFKKELSYITDYYDFSKPHYINNSNQFWYETSHFTLEVGDLILDKIYYNKDPYKYGKYISIQKKGE